MIHFTRAKRVKYLEKILSPTEHDGDEEMDEKEMIQSDEYYNILSEIISTMGVTTDWKSFTEKAFQSVEDYSTDKEQPLVKTIS